MPGGPAPPGCAPGQLAPGAALAQRLAVAARGALRVMPPKLRLQLDERVRRVTADAAAAAAAMPNAVLVDREAYLQEGDVHEWLHLSRRATHAVAAAVASEVVGGAAQQAAADEDGDLDLPRAKRHRVESCAGIESQ